MMYGYYLVKLTGALVEEDVITNRTSKKRKFYFFPIYQQ